MAEVKNNIITEGLSGMLGDRIVFRQMRDKAIISGEKWYFNNYIYANRSYINGARIRQRWQ